MNTSFLDYYNIRPLTGWIHDVLCGVMPEALAVFLGVRGYRCCSYTSLFSAGHCSYLYGT